MTARMGNPAVVVPGAMDALQAAHKAVVGTGISERTLELVSIRASQINGCGVCLDMHHKIAKHLGETDDRIHVLAGWRDTSYFSDAERAALAIAESVTRLADRTDAVPDAVYDEAAKHYDEAQLGALILHVGLINVWNRINIATHQLAGGAWA
ncbi:carboxymuconolactone decarboxylase family protein [Streptomyces sp. NBC_01408]|uniref:carboxymuconolactone decarboxylase family protein n=1 Tax=Streptomyces sp. NBC_01408 TaxID=2903855 RepID=UPI00224E0193|nr:carboxymuconolactone decarboxylase family protein [Streptomyces sp. NBC_01408]MCX4696928.1 carboxymuconolactone decarboxylase family protein [Streptomyces sp. NBC_01408]